MQALERQARMVYVEPVGTGESGRLADDADYRLDTYARFLRAVVDDLGAGPVTMLGHSHGGFVVQRFALAYPADVTSLVLYDSSPVTGPEFWGAAAANIQRCGGEIAAAFNSQHAAMTDDELTAVLRTVLPAYVSHAGPEIARLRAGIRMWSGPSRGQDAPFDVRDRLAEITVPVLVLAGVDDFICGPPWARQLHEGLPASRLCLIDDCGQLAHLERPDIFYPEVLKVLGRSTRSRR